MKSIQSDERFDSLCYHVGAFLHIAIMFIFSYFVTYLLIIKKKKNLKIDADA